MANPRFEQSQNSKDVDLKKSAAFFVLGGCSGDGAMMPAYLFFGFDLIFAKMWPFLGRFPCGFFIECAGAGFFSRSRTARKCEY